MLSYLSNFIRLIFRSYIYFISAIPKYFILTMWCLHECVRACAGACVWCMRYVGTFVCVSDSTPLHAGGRKTNSHVFDFCLVWGRGLCVAHSSVCQASPQTSVDSPFSLSHPVVGVPGFVLYWTWLSCGVWGFELSSSCLQDKRFTYRPSSQPLNISFFRGIFFNF